MEKRGINNLAIAFHGRRMYCGDDEAVVVWDTTTMKELRRIEINSSVMRLSVCDVDDDDDDGGTLLLGCEDLSGRVVDMKTKKTVMLVGHTYPISCIIACEDTDVLSSSDDKTIRRWNRSTGECLRIYNDHSDWVLSILFDRATKRIFSASADSTIKVWNAETGERIAEMIGHSSAVFSIAWVNSTTIVSGSDDTTVKLWNITTMKELKTMIRHQSSVYSVAVTPGKDQVISGSFDKNVILWNFSPEECFCNLTQNSHVYNVAVSPDGKFLASGGSVSMLTLFRVKPPFPFIVHESSLADSSQTACDYCLLSDGTLLRSGEPFRTITRSTRCILDTDTRFSLIDNQRDAFSAVSRTSAQQWMDAVCAVQRDVSLPPEKRSDSFLRMMFRDRFDLIQTINIHNKIGNSRLFLPKDVVNVVGNCVFMK